MQPRLLLTIHGVTLLVVTQVLSVCVLLLHRWFTTKCVQAGRKFVVHKLIVVNMRETWARHNNTLLRHHQCHQSPEQWLDSVATAATAAAAACQALRSKA